MALLFMDSFDHYATEDITEKWTGVTPDPTKVAIGAYGRNGTQGVKVPSAYAYTCLYATVLGGVDEAIIGVAIKPAKFTGTLGTSGIVMFGSALAWECGLYLHTDLTVQPFRVTAGPYVPGYELGAGNFTLIGSASAVALQVGVFAYLEVQMKCANAPDGTCTVRINGTEVLALTGLDTLYTSATLSRIGLACGYNNNTVMDYDDLVVMDTTGAVNNAFLGDVTISALLPSGAGTTSGWTPSAGSNYQNVDEALVNDDTDYNSTSTLNAKDTYAMANVAAGADIRAVQIVTAQRKGAEGPGKIKHVVRSGGTDYDLTEQGIGGTTYSFLRSVVETDPATAAAWSESGFNAVEIGIKKTG